MKRLTLALAAACALILAACGGLQPISQHAKPSTTLQKCSPTDQAMQCVLQHQPLPPLNLKTPLGATTSLGIDFTLWGGCPSPSGHSFGFSYLSYDSSKDWNSGCVAEWHRAGAATGAVFEASGSPSGFSTGGNDARAAASELHALGAPSNYPIILAIDCDCSLSQFQSYFQGANQAEPGRINAYGGFGQILALFNAHLVGHDNWQTYAWSNGQWLSASIAPVEQYLLGSSTDDDRSYVGAHGGWLLASAPPKPRTVCWGKHSTPTSTKCKTIEAQASHDWAQYVAFHNGLLAHQKQLRVVAPFPGYYQQTKKSIGVPGYKGPGIGYLNGRIATETKWAGLYRARHDQLVKEYHS